MKFSCRSLAFVVACLAVSYAHTDIGDAEVGGAETNRVVWRQKRVIGGSLAQAGQWPWLISLRAHVPTKYIWRLAVQYQDIFCGGAIINSRWILTAAHCIIAPDAAPNVQAKLNNTSNWYVKAGSVRLYYTFGQRLCALWNHIVNNTNVGCWYYKVSKIIQHPEFNVNAQFVNDIALIKLSRDLPLNVVNSTVAAVLLPLNGTVSGTWPAPGTQCAFQGWGCTTQGGQVQNFAQQLSLSIPSTQSQCVDGGVALQPSQLCAGTTQNLCKGDSGSPLVCLDSAGKWRQAGIASYTSGSVPGVFTRVTSFMPWITSTISAN